MTLLVDTHAFLWFCQGEQRLSTRAKSIIEDPSNRKLVRIASIWEIAIKAGLGKLKLGEPCDTYFANALARTGFEILPVTLKHAAGVETLALHHRDPFDRLLVAQAFVEGAPIVSIDDTFDAYGVTRIW